MLQIRHARYLIGGEFAFELEAFVADRVFVQELDCAQQYPRHQAAGKASATVDFSQAMLQDPGEDLFVVSVFGFRAPAAGRRVRSCVLFSEVKGVMVFRSRE